MKASKLSNRCGRAIVDLATRIRCRENLGGWVAERGNRKAVESRKRCLAR